MSAARDRCLELERAIAHADEHLSLYQLTIEPGTRFETLVRQGQFTPLDDDAAADLFTLTQDLTTSAGLPAYEISNHARPGAESRHNLIYWRYGEYAGIGPGAHGRADEAPQGLPSVARLVPTFKMFRTYAVTGGYTGADALILPY